MEAYDFGKNESKWRKKWDELKLYSTPKLEEADQKYYILPQLPYPSGSGLHVGHAEVYSACDILARFKRMQGKKVLQVIGWDAFGLPAENYAIKTNVHPRINTDKAIDNFRDQIHKMGVSVDWDREVGSHNPDYYKWTQWFFLLMYNQGLAYRKNQKVNWCDSCKTVLANEQVIDKDGKEVCERCDSEIQHKMMEQWYLKITEYADRLAKDLDKVDWPAETVKRQRDWIGRSEGATVKFELASEQKEENKKFIEVFTTRIDTLFGATYLVLAPEHDLVSKIVSEDQRENVEAYIRLAKKKSEIERTDMTKEKTGVFTGAYAINPINNKQIPIWIADYVLVEYGTGAIMAVPAHDKRDWDFATKFQLDMVEVIKKPDSFTGEVYTGVDSVLINSDKFDGLSVKEAQKRIVDKLAKESLGENKVTFKLRDWSVSRQRFWGAPIPFLRKEIENDKYLTKPDLFVNFHAWDSNSKSTYHPWIEEQLRRQNIEVINPDLPNSTMPVLEEWLGEVEKQTATKDLSNSVISGRSLGGWAAMKFVETNKVRKLILVAPSTVTPFGFKSWQKYAETPEILESLKNFVGFDEGGNIDFEKVKENAQEILLIISRNDPYIDYQETIDFLKERLGNIRVMSFRDSKHFKLEDGYSEFPKLLEEITKDVRPDLQPIPENDLPVILPDDVDFVPTGQSPLKYSKKFHEGVEEKYGKGFSRESDTLDTFMCSSWYYYRYLDPKNDQAFASPEVLKRWMPVDFYLGGPEHVNGHLLYSRFFTKVLYDAGFIDFDEPFSVHKHQGLILGEDNRKMSKRWGNVINPSDVVDEHGADTLRMYEMFMGPLEETKPWSSKGVLGIKRFLNKVWFLQAKVQQEANNRTQESLINRLIINVTNDIENLSFNTAIAKYMEFINTLSKDEIVSSEVWKKFLCLLAPFAPFISEELWARLGNHVSIHQMQWPVAESSKILSEKIKMAVQINGKVRAIIQVDAGLEQEKVLDIATESQNIARYLEEKSIRKVIFVKDKIINIIL